MAATGEPYSVAARALDAAEPGVQEPRVHEPGAAEPRVAGFVAGERVAGEGVAGEGVAADPAGALAAVIACAAGTLAAPSARVEIRSDADLGRPPERAQRRRPGLVGRLAGRAARGILGRVAPDIGAAELREAREAFLHQFGAGFVEPAAGRYLIDFGGWAQVLTDGRRFSGRSGEPLGPRYENRLWRSRRDDPLDALRRLQAATAARWVGEETVRLTRCRVVAATAGRDQFTVWIDDERIRRFRTVERGSGRSAQATTTETTELWDFGVPVDSLDWSRLPAFRADR